MAAPLITLTNANSATLGTASYGNVDASSNSGIQQIYVWNNMNGSQTLSDAIQCTITTKTWNKLDTGDTVQNGQEVVTDLMFQVQCTSQGDTSYTAVGGPTTAPIGNASIGTIQGTVGGTAAIVNTQIVAPSTVTAGQAQFIIRVSYLYQ